MLTYHLHSAGAILEDLVAVLRNYIGVLLKMSDAIALLDMLRAFTHLVSVSETFCRPEFADGPLAIRQGYAIVCTRSTCRPFPSVPRDVKPLSGSTH